MNKNKTLIAILMVVSMLIIAGGTAFVLQRSDSNSQSQTTPENKDDDSSNDGGNKEDDQQPLKDDIDPEINDKASKIEAEADDLINSDPEKASEKYQEAGRLYDEAGNKNKAGDMFDNSKTAESMIPEKEPEIGDPVVTPGVVPESP